MRDMGHHSARFLGYVQLQVGSKVFALPVQAAPLHRPDGSVAPGGFFTEGDSKDSYGILVDSDASDADLQEQIRRGSLEAIRHISRKFLN